LIKSGDVVLTALTSSEAGLTLRQYVVVFGPVEDSAVYYFFEPFAYAADQ